MRAACALQRPRRRTTCGEFSMSKPSDQSAVLSRPGSSVASRSLSQLVPVEPATKPSIRILVADDERTLRESCASVLGVEGYNVTVTGRGEEALELLRRRAFDIVLLDLYMTPVSGSELLAAALAANADTIAIVITGKPTVEASLQVLRAGAWDFLPKPFTGSQLQILVGRAAHAVAVARESRVLHEQRGVQPGDRVAVLGSAAKYNEVIALARRVAATDASVFITGESGSGKELIAQFIHHHSRRACRPVVAVNCAALPEMLLESEMFGHCKGAFTGAVRDKPGLLETANGGTMFLDELIEMSKPIQAKLLRVIQDGVVRRVGSETTDAVVNVRFIAATNRDPDEAVASGALREDLYYRLRVVPIHVPALRERVDDIPLLAEHFLQYYWKRHREGEDPVAHLSKSAIWALRAHSWPGNVRELQNVIEHAVVPLVPGADARARRPPCRSHLGGHYRRDPPRRRSLAHRGDLGGLPPLVQRAGGEPAGRPRPRRRPAAARVRHAAPPPARRRARPPTGRHATYRAVVRVVRVGPGALPGRDPRHPERAGGGAPGDRAARRPRARGAAVGRAGSRAAGRGDPRPPLTAHLHLVPGRNAPARAERRGERRTTPPAGVDLRRRAGTELDRERCDRVVAGRPLAGGWRCDVVPADRAVLFGALHRAAPRRREGPRRAYRHARRRPPGGAPRRSLPRAPEPDHQRAQVYGAGLRRDRLRRAARRARRAVGPGHRSRHQSRRVGEPVRATPARPQPDWLLLLGHGPGARDHTPADRSAGLDPPVRDPSRLGHPLLLRPGPATAHRNARARGQRQHHEARLAASPP